MCHLSPVFFQLSDLHFLQTIKSAGVDLAKDSSCQTQVDALGAQPTTVSPTCGEDTVSPMPSDACN